MNKKKMILTSLASVAILGAGFVTSQPVTVKAEVASTASASSTVEQAKSKVDEAQKNYNEAQKNYSEKLQ
ncbi:TPA: pneumococcal surface A domain protein [Streptococcus pneumoniae]|nr:pneumococcal surface A domain protein [Streptococcus pneumoniae]